MFIHQEKYAREFARRFGMENCKKIETLVLSSYKLDKGEKGKTVDQKVYVSMIGSLLYLTTSRPDIFFSMCTCARFQSDPR